ncbi:Guanine deaminase [Exaiptasia diaphana]|nr:Guanine deaminase [Exaiptasia diaphana]
MYPNCAHYTDVYKQYGLLTDRSYMAHCCHVSQAEATMLAKCGTGISHCPASNVNLHSGLADVKFLESQNIKVGLGTDVSGGHSYSMLNAIQSAMTVSNILAMRCDGYKPISHREAFYLATLGGSKVLGLDKIVGNFEVGKEFDALLVDGASQESVFDCFDDDDMEQVVQKFLYCADDRNIKKVFVAGKMVAGKDKKHDN